MNTPAELQARLVKAHERCQAGKIAPEAYKRIERQVMRDLKAAHRQAYGFAMENGGKS